jgi:hypothetical protein
VALVTSAGFVAPGDTPFDLDLKGGDASFRTIAGDTALDALTMHHKSDAYHPAPIAADRNAVPVISLVGSDLIKLL